MEHANGAHMKLQKHQEVERTRERECLEGQVKVIAMQRYLRDQVVGSKYKAHAVTRKCETVSPRYQRRWSVTLEEQGSRYNTSVES